MVNSADLTTRGWHLTPEGIEQCEINSSKSSLEAVIKSASDIDLKDIGEKWLPEELSRGRAEYVQGPGVLQIQKIRNIAAPKDNEESHAAPRLLKLTLTDGHSNCIAIEIESLDKISLNTPPGTKVLLPGIIPVEHGYLHLRNKDFMFLGGRVDKLVENWQFKRKLIGQARGNVTSEGGPPPFIPFGKKIESVSSINRKDGNFKSLAAGKEKKPESGEFEQQRQATIAEVLQKKEDGKPISFGGGKTQSEEFNDRSDKRDFKSVQSDWNGWNNKQPLNERNRPQSFEKNDRGESRAPKLAQYERVDRSKPVQIERNDRREPRQGRGKKSGKENEDGDDLAPGRPSGPATLFDFLETKISKPDSKSDSGMKNNSNNSYQNVTSSNSGSRGPPYNSLNKKFDDRPPITANRTQKQSIPPRFANKMKDVPSNSVDYKNSTSQSRSGYSDSSRGQRGANNDYTGERTSRNYNKEQQGRNFVHNDQNSQSVDSNYSEDGQTSQYSNQKHKQSFRPSSDYNSAGRNSLNYSRQQYGNDSNLQYSAKPYNQKYNNSYDPYQNRPKSSYTSMDSGAPRGGNPYGANRKSWIQEDNDNSASGKEITYDSGGGGATVEWNTGDKCLAKYWEDGQYYQAVIEAVAPHLPTCVVTYLEYGNTEEVMLTDVKQLINTAANVISRQNIPQNRHQYTSHQNANQGMPEAPPYPGENTLVSGGQITSMEFRRGGGGGNKFRSRDVDRGKPTQEYYQPPSARKKSE